MPDTQTRNGRARRIGALLVATALLGSGAPAHAAGSAPTLAITSVSAFETSDAARGTTVSGTFNYDDLLQFSFPAGVIVFQGSEFTRYDLSGTITSGSSALVADGIIDLDIVPLLSVGTPTAAPASIVKLRPGEVSILLPASVVSGSTSAVLYGVVNDDLGSPGPGTAFVSNTVQFVAP